MLRAAKGVLATQVKTMKSEYKGYIEKKCELCKASDMFSPDLYSKYDVKKGLRDSEGNGVIVGLTRVSQVDGS
jgi:citrate synthase